MRTNRLTEVSEPQGFSLVDSQPEPEDAEQKKRDAFDDRYTNLLAISLRALSQRATVAVASLFTLLLAASAFWLWMMILPNPTVLQLVGLGMYAIFALALEFVKRRK